MILYHQGLRKQIYNVQFFLHKFIKMLEELKKYQYRIQQSKKKDEDMFEEIRQKVLKQLKQYLDKQLEEHAKQYNNIRKQRFTQEQKSLDYYISLYENKQSDLQSVVKNPSVNFYSLFKCIDDKICRNSHFINSFELNFSYPSPSLQNYHEVSKKYQLLQNHYEQVYNFIVSSQNIMKYAKKQLQVIQKFQKKRLELKKKIKNKNYISTLKIKGTLQEVLESLIIHEHIEEQNLSIRGNGIMSIQNYEKLMEQIYRHRVFTKQVHLKIMDMQFCQEKCDIMKRYLTKMSLNELKIQNYYPECKLGNFVDFSWAPFRKKINLKGCAWN